MTKISSLIFTISFLALAAPVAAVEGSPAIKWCNSASITGTVQKSTITHPFNKTKFPVFTLVLKQPLTIAAGEGECSEMEKTTTKEVQIQDDPSVIGKYVGKMITVSGELMVPENAYHVRPAVLFPPISIKAE